MEDIKKIIDETFRRYGAPSEDANIETRLYITRPDKINELGRIAYYDRTTAEHITKLKKTIEKLEAYRIALSQRYNYIATAPTIPVVKLTRRKDYYNNKVFYYLTTYNKNILDGEEVRTSETKYIGKERQKAINDYNNYVAAHPNIIAEINIKVY